MVCDTPGKGGEGRLHGILGNGIKVNAPFVRYLKVSAH